MFATRGFADWMALFGQHDVPAGAANSRQTLATDPHFLARDNVYDVELPGAGKMHLTTTPVKVAGQSFSPAIAPTAGKDQQTVLADWLG